MARKESKVTMYFVDTNIFVRFFTNDNQKKAQRCRQLFLKAKNNQLKLATTTSVIAEVVYVLSSRYIYKQTPTEIVNRLYPLLSLPNLQIDNKPVLIRALQLYKVNSINFTDALILADMENNSLTDLYSYDHDFNRTRGYQVIRHEP